jgi:Ca2+-binding RTX toxin-like protein
MATITGGNGGETLRGTARGDLITGQAPLSASTTAPGFTQLVAGGLGTALFACAAPGDAGLLYVLDKAGIIRTVNTTTGAVTGTLLNIDPQVSSAGEQGLLGMAFHPDFWANGKFYLFFSKNDGDSLVREYRVDPANPDAVLAGSARDILTIPQPGSASNHKAGWIGFGPDGMLYVATGDGGGGGDPLGTGQNPNDLLGSILRIDVNGDGFPADAARNYAIPAGNPFAAGGGAPEVWAYGLRNPFRDSFDRGDGRLWIADVGQDSVEEVDIGAPGANFGWVTYEGPGGPAAGFTFPVHSYSHADGDRSIIGGYVHRGPESGLQGQYVFGDFASGRLWRLADFDGDGDLDRQTLDDGGLLGGGLLASFAEDAEGRLYAVALNGTLYRLDPGAPTGAVQDGADTIAAGAGDDRVFAGAGDDVVNGGTGNDLLSGMEGQDRLIGLAGADTLLGGAGNDLLQGGTEADLLLGGDGADRLMGQDGADLLHGGAGADLLRGGLGADRFRWTTISDSARGVALDRVLDFSRAEGDRLDVSALAPGVFSFLGSAAFAASGAQIRAVAQGAATRVEISVDGGPADMVMLVVGTTPLQAGDFIL